MAYLRAAPSAVGDDVASAAQPGDITDQQFRSRMLTAQETRTKAYLDWRIDDQKMRRIQIAATLAIPLAAAIWRVILGRKSSSIL